MKKMETGKLKHKINIYKLDENEYYKFDRSTRANIKYKGGSKNETDESTFFTINALITVQHYINVYPQDRIEYKDDLFEIDFVEPDELKLCQYLSVHKIHTDELMPDETEPEEEVELPVEPADPGSENDAD